MQRPVAGDQVVHIGVVDGAHHDAHGMALQRMKKRSNLPSAKMPGEEEHALAALFGGVEILEALVNGDFRDVVRCVAGEEAELSEQSSQRPIDPTENPCLLYTSDAADE